MLEKKENLEKKTSSALSHGRKSYLIEIKIDEM
jgi:hypothetical protein